MHMLIDPPFAEPTQLERPGLIEACVAFREKFSAEPWYVRVVASHEDAGWFTLVVDARYWPRERMRLSSWMGYAVAVAQVPGSIAEQERKRTEEAQAEKAVDEPKIAELEEAIEKFKSMYGDCKWYVDVAGTIGDGSPSALAITVNGRYWTGYRGGFHHKGKRYPVIVTIMPEEMMEGERD